MALLGGAIHRGAIVSSFAQYLPWDQAQNTTK
jgi:hypothetical protein